jgi:hypothetical protein
MVTHREETGVRAFLVAALASCADTPLRNGVLRFLRGLSSDELQFIAEFLGASLLEGAAGSGPLADFHREQPAGAQPRGRQNDLDHKLILVREYLAIARSRRLPGVPA